MNLIKKIEYHYYLKIIDDLVLNQKYNELDLLLNNLFKKSSLLFFQILKKFYISFQKINNTQNLFPNNIIYVNSFDVDDINIINNFLNYYLNEVGHANASFSDLGLELSKCQNLLASKKTLSFNDIIENSVLYQIMMSMNKSDHIKIYKNEFAFFSTSNDFNFADPNSVKCYFLVVDHPYNVYQKIKDNNNQDKFISQNIMFNLDSSLIQKNYEGVDVEIIKKDWATYNKSWTDPNVYNSFKGMIIKKSELIDNTQEVLSSIILHLNQSNLDIKLDYNLIDNYSTQLRTTNQNSLNNLSNNEKKFIQKNIKDSLLDLEFEL